MRHRSCTSTLAADSNHQLGRTRFDRLFHIGKACVPLCVEALKQAVREAKQGNDVGRYKDAWDCISVAAPTEPEAVYDPTWVAQKEDINAQETARLELELKGYKNNLVKESIRVGRQVRLPPIHFCVH